MSVVLVNGFYNVEHGQDQIIEGRHYLGRVPFANLAVIFPQGTARRECEPIFDGPVPTHRFQQP